MVASTPDVVHFQASEKPLPADHAAVGTPKSAEAKENPMPDGRIAYACAYARLFVAYFLGDSFDHSHSHSHLGADTNPAANTHNYLQAFRKGKPSKKTSKR